MYMYIITYNPLYMYLELISVTMNDNGLLRSQVAVMASRNFNKNIFFYRIYTLDI